MYLQPAVYQQTGIVVHYRSSFPAGLGMHRICMYYYIPLLCISQPPIISHNRTLGWNYIISFARNNIHLLTNLHLALVKHTYIKMKIFPLNSFMNIILFYFLRKCEKGRNLFFIIFWNTLSSAFQHTFIGIIKKKQVHSIFQYRSLLDNAPNYLIGCVTQKRYFFFHQPTVFSRQRMASIAWIWATASASAAR